MNTEKFIVRLSDEERQELETIVKKLKGTSQKVNRALALLHAPMPMAPTGQMNKSHHVQV